MRKYARYKDSGISWIGEVPEHWDVIPMKRLFVNRKSGSWGEDELHNDLDRICLRIADFDMTELRFKRNIDYTIRNYKQDVIEKCALKKGDILIEKSGGGEKTPVGRAVLYDLTLNEPLFANFMDRLRCSEGVDSYYVIFLWNMMNSKGAVWNYVKQTTGIQNLDIGALLSAENVCVPPPSEQKAIAEYLDKKTAQINELVSAKQKQIELLKEYKQSVIANAVTGKLNKNCRMKDSGVSWIGKIPENWECSTLRKHLKFVSDKGHPNEQLLSVTREQGVIIRNVESKEENHNVIPEDLSDYKLVKQGQFAINKMKSWQGSYGVSSFTGIVSPAYYICDLDFENKDFFSIAIRSKAYIPFFTMYSKGIRVDQWDLSPIGLKIIPFFIPPEEEQNKIVSLVKDKMEKIDSQVASIENQIANLNEYRQSIISEVVTGKVKVC
jgi:type I restriction enzyme S subunit